MPGFGQFGLLPTVRSGSKLNYPAIIIGEQKWYQKNYYDTKTKMGFQIPKVEDAETWVTSKTLYNNAIAGGATEREALQEAAMWCYYNNDSALGKVYGVLYNYFAAKLIQTDIDLYNAAHVSNPFNYKVATRLSYIDLYNYLGGATGSGGKLKEAGLEHWNSPNEGATNESGFTGLGAGIRSHTGVFQSFKGEAYFWTQDNYTADTAWQLWLSSGSANTGTAAGYKERGFSIRLVSTLTFPIPLT